MNYAHYLMFGKNKQYSTMQLLSSSVLQEHNQPVPLADLPSLVPLTKYTHEQTALVFEAINSQICIANTFAD